MGEHVGIQRIERLRRRCFVVVPPDRLVGDPVGHGELVVLRAPGMDPGSGGKGAAFRDKRLAKPEASSTRRGASKL
jgi:hypothetical protein